MVEKDLYSPFGHIIRDKFPKEGSASFELKIVHKDKPFYTRQLPEDQNRALRMCSLNGVYFKIPDDSRGNKPWDSFILRGQGYLVVYFEISKKYYLIKIERYNEYINEKTIKLKEEECRNLSNFIY